MWKSWNVRSLVWALGSLVFIRTNIYICSVMSIGNKVLVLKLYSSGFRVKLKFSVINFSSNVRLLFVWVSSISLEWITHRHRPLICGWVANILFLTLFWNTQRRELIKQIFSCSLRNSRDTICAHLPTQPDFSKYRFHLINISQIILETSITSMRERKIYKLV